MPSAPIRPSAMLTKEPVPMMDLIAYPAQFGEPSASPFCVKAMCLLQMAGVDWRHEETNDPRKAPKAKLPVLKDGDETIPDSEQIRAHLEARHGADFDKGLDPAQRGAARAVTRMMDEHLYFGIVCDRWMDDANWAIIKEAYFSQIPVLVRGVITPMVRRQAMSQVRHQGMGRHSDEERLTRCRHDVEAVAGLLGDKPFLFGDAPTSADASAVPMLRAAAGAPVATPLSELLHGKTELMAYLERGKAAMYPAYADA